VTSTPSQKTGKSRFAGWEAAFQKSLKITVTHGGGRLVFDCLTLKPLHDENAQKTL
jgi:phosphoribosylformylglycinamidine (FGAM) synthase-like amidotransferase family enzyme